MARLISFILTAAIALYAHPHIFVDAQASLIFNADEFVGVQNRWEFDLIYSQAMIASADKNQNGHFEKNELDFLEEKNIKPYLAFSRFNYLGDGNQFYNPKEIQNLKASISAEGKLVLEFLNAFHIPGISNDYTMLVLVVNDPSNYISITIDMEKSTVQSPKEMDVEYFVDALDGLTQFKNFSRQVKGVYVRYKKTN